MARLFDIVGTEIVLNPNTLAVPQFKKIWNRDKSKGKEFAIKEITYVVFLCDFISPYKDLPEYERGNIIKADIFKGEKWTSDEVIEEAIDKYNQLQETPNMRLLKSARSTLEKMADYFDKIDFEETDSFGKLKYSAKDVASNLTSVGNIVKSLTSLEQQVKKEVIESNVRGDNEIGPFEIPRS